MEKVTRIIGDILVGAGVMVALVIAISTCSWAATSATQSQAIQAEEPIEKENWVAFNDGKGCTVTAYCLCRKCCGKNYQKAITASGETPQRYITVANGSLPFGTRVYIEGIGYRIVQDRGSAVGPKHFDVYVGEDNHEYAKQFGSRKLKVWIIKE